MNFVNKEVISLKESDKWRECRENFITEFGSYFEKFGASEIMGRIMGLLVYAPEPLSLTEIADMLQISKAAASIHIRAMRQLELAEKVSVPGDRRDYYWLNPDFGEKMLAGEKIKIRIFLTLIDKALSSLHDLTDLKGKEKKAAELAFRRIVSIKKLFELHNQMLDDITRQWEEIKMTGKE